MLKKFKNLMPFMASFNIKLLFTNILLIETLKPLCTKPLQKSDMLATILRGKDTTFITCLKLPCLNDFFIFDGNFYERCDSIAMGSS